MKTDLKFLIRNCQHEDDLRMLENFKAEIQKENIMLSNLAYKTQQVNPSLASIIMCLVIKNKEILGEE